MSEWIQIDPKQYVEPQVEEIRGVKVRVSVSPYQIPQKVRGFWNEKKSKFIIQFAYMMEERTRPVELQENIVAHIGCNSKRIYTIEVNTDALNAKAVGLEIAVKGSFGKGVELADTDNSPIVQSILERKALDIFEVA